MSMQKLSLKGFLQEMEEVSSGAHPRKFCFVLGAGASIHSGIPSGQKLVQRWEKELQERDPAGHTKWKQSQKITEENMSEHYSAYYERRFARCPTDGLNYMEKIMESAQPSAGYVMLSHMLTETPHNVVVTTNFDHLTEDAVNYYAHQTPLVVGHEALAKYIVEDPKRPTIIKIHRDLLFDPKSRTEDLKELAENWKTGLEKIFSNYHPIFIGYAGNDESLMNFLNANVEKFKDGSWKFPYWTVYKDDPIEGKVKEFLEASEGYVISQEGFDEVMIQMGAKFGYKIPTEEAFLEEPKKRYKDLKDAIDAVSDRKSKQVLPCKEKTEEEKPQPEPCVENKMSEEVGEALSQITSTAEAQQIFQKANALMADDKFSEAKALLEKLVKMEPNNARYHEKLCFVLMMEDKNEKALLEAQKSVELDPKSAQGHVLLARILEKMGSRDEALRECQKAIEIDPNDTLGYLKMGDVLEKNGKYDEAMDNYRKAMEINLNDSFVYLKMATLLKKFGEYDEALQNYKKAMEIDPNDILPYLGMGAILERTKKYNEALKVYNKINKINPNYIPAYSKIGAIEERNGNYEEALNNYRKAVELAPEWDAILADRIQKVQRRLNEKKS